MKSKEIIHDFIEKIALGEFPIDSKVPSEAQLSIKYDCNRHTIRKVLESLIERGYLKKTHKGPTYINELPSNHSLTLSSFYELHKGDSIKTDILKFNIIKTSEYLSNKLKINIDAKVWEIVRVRYVNDIPDHIEETYMPYSLFEDLSIDICKNSILSYIENECKYSISHSLKNIKAIQLNDYESSILKKDKNSLAIQIENIGYLTNGRIYE